MCTAQSLYVKPLSIKQGRCSISCSEKPSISSELHRSMGRLSRPYPISILSWWLGTEASAGISKNLKVPCLHVCGHRDLLCGSRVWVVGMQWTMGCLWASCGQKWWQMDRMTWRMVNESVKPQGWQILLGRALSNSPPGSSGIGGAQKSKRFQHWKSPPDSWHL